MTDNEIRLSLIERKRHQRKAEEWKQLAIGTPLMMFVVVFSLWWGM